MGGSDATVTNATNVLREIDVICFDLFGTLIEITDRRRPFAPAQSSGCLLITQHELGVDLLRHRSGRKPRCSPRGPIPNFPGLPFQITDHLGDPI